MNDSIGLSGRCERQSAATVSGADTSIFVNTPGGYQQTNTLAAGQGAWALSPGDGTLTIAVTGPLLP